MTTYFKVGAWIAGAILGVLVWNVFPDFRPLVTWVLAAAFICHVLAVIVEATVKRLISGELLELRRQCTATAARLDILDRKVTAILRDALEQRRLR